MNARLFFLLTKEVIDFDEFIELISFSFVLTSDLTGIYFLKDGSPDCYVFDIVLSNGSSFDVFVE